MSKQRNPAADLDDDSPRLNSLAEIHDADRRLQQAYRAGEITQEELKRRRGLVNAAATPRELWKASGHRAGSPERSDKAEL